MGRSDRLRLPRLRGCRGSGHRHGRHAPGSRGRTVWARSVEPTRDLRPGDDHGDAADGPDRNDARHRRGTRSVSLVQLRARVSPTGEQSPGRVGDRAPASARRALRRPTARDPRSHRSRRARPRCTGRVGRRRLAGSRHCCGGVCGRHDRSVRVRARTDRTELGSDAPPDRGQLISSATAVSNASSTADESRAALPSRKSARIPRPAMNRPPQP